MKAWNIATATTVGESHVYRGKGSDDAIATARNEKWNALVASDGAGSAKRSREGADFVSSAFAKQLLEIASEIDHRGPGPWLNDALIGGILNVRKELAGAAGSYDMRDFHCTLVAVLVSDSGGFSVHIGDGAVFIGRLSPSGSAQIVVHSEPENGEYANETYFVTETTWLKNLRIKPLGQCEWVAVTTDGAASLLLSQSVKHVVFCEIFEELSNESSLDGVNRVLADLINSDFSRNVSNDDKSIGLAFQSYSVFSNYMHPSTEHSGLPNKTERSFNSVVEQPKTALPHSYSDTGWLTEAQPKLCKMHPSQGNAITPFFLLITIAAVIIAVYFLVLKPQVPGFVPAAQCSHPLSNKPYPCGL